MSGDAARPAILIMFTKRPRVSRRSGKVALQTATTAKKFTSMILR